MMARLAAAVALATSVCVLSGNALHAQGSPVTYLYDDLGRLVGVIDASGESAVYVYDAVGNLLSIQRQTPGTVSIISFSPQSGSVGATVTIYGTGFSPTPGNNQLTFNGVAATVTSASPNQLVATVPSAATTGALAVTTPSGSATSATPFTVGSSLVPLISGFSPGIGVVGASVTITGSNFDAVAAQNKVKLNLSVASVSSADPFTVVAAVPPFVTSGRISLTTQYGTGVSASDFFVPPAPYTAPDVLVTGRVSVGGGISVPLVTANKIALVVFDGMPGQRVDVVAAMASGSWGCGWVLRMFEPYGTVLGETAPCATQGILEPQTLPVAGTYTLMIDPAGTFTGTANVNFYDVVDVTTPIVAGGSSVAAAVTTPGQNARLPFSGTAGQRVSMLVAMTSGNFGCGAGLEIRKAADNSLVGGGTMCSTGSGFLEPVTLPATDSYVAVVNPVLWYTGTANVNLYDVVDVTTSIVTNGPSVSAPLTTPGQNARLPFSGTAGQRVSMLVAMTSGNFGCGTGLEIRKASDNSLVGGGTMCSTGSGFLEPVTLPATDNYVAVVNPTVSFTGTANVNLYDVVDVTSPIAVNGPPVAASLTTPGQNARLPFSGTAGQQLTVQVTMTSGVFGCGSKIEIHKAADNSVVGTGSMCTSGTASLGPVTLPATDNYVVVVDPTLATTGTADVTLTAP